MTGILALFADLNPPFPRLPARYGRTQDRERQAPQPVVAPPLIGRAPRRRCIGLQGVVFVQDVGIGRFIQGQIHDYTCLDSGADQL